MALARPDTAAHSSTPSFLLLPPQRLKISPRLNRSSTILAVPSHPPGEHARALPRIREPTSSGVTSRMLEQLTYAQIGDRLNISSEGARAIVKRNRLPRSHDKNGKTVVAIDLDGLQHKPLPVRPRLPVTDVTATLKARIEQLETELTAEQQRSAGHWAQYEHERERAELLARSHEKLDIQLKNLRLHLQAGRQGTAPLTLRHWWRWLRATG